MLRLQGQPLIDIATLEVCADVTGHTPIPKAKYSATLQSTDRAYVASLAHELVTQFSGKNKVAAGWLYWAPQPEHTAAALTAFNCARQVLQKLRAGVVGIPFPVHGKEGSGLKRPAAAAAAKEGAGATGAAAAGSGGSSRAGAGAGTEESPGQGAASAAGPMLWGYKLLILPISAQACNLKRRVSRAGGPGTVMLPSLLS